MRIRLAPQARSDLDAIWGYIAKDTSSEETATRVIESITSKFLLFSKFPYIGRALDSEKHCEVRTFAVHPYLIFYRPLPGEIRILRVIHTSRDAFAVFIDQ